MTLSRSTVVFAVALAMLATGCSRFAPKPGSAIKEVGIELAFGVDADAFVTQPPPPFVQPPPFVIEIPPPPPRPTSTFRDPPPPVLCPPVQTNAAAQLPSSMGDHPQELDSQTGGQPKDGSYLARFEGNRSSKPQITEGGWLEVTLPNREPGAYYYFVRNPFTEISYRLTIVYEQLNAAGGSNNDVAGIYFSGIDMPRKDDVGQNDPDKQRALRSTGNGAKIVAFPIAEGNRVNSTANFIDPSGTQSGVGQIFSPGTIVSITATVQGDDRIPVCDDLAAAWVVNMTIEARGDTEFKIVGTFWIAPQFGGFPIKESYIMTGGTEWQSGNFGMNLMRLTPVKFD